MKNAFCVDHLSVATTVQNAKLVVQNLPVGARLQNFWQTWLDLGAGPKVIQILREGYTLPFRIRPKLTRSPTVISRYVNPHRNSYLLEALHQLIDKNAVELAQNQKSLGFFNRLFLVPKSNNKWRPILDLSKLNLFLKVEKFKMETPETIRTSLQEGEWVTSIDFKDAYFHIPIQETGMRSGPLCALLWRILTWCTRKQVTVKARHIPGRLNVVSPSRGLPNNMQQVAPASNRLFCHEVQQQVASVYVSCTGSPDYSSGRTQSTMGGSGCIRLPTSSHIGQSGGEIAGLTMQENYSDCPGVAQHALVLGPSGHVQSNPTEPAQSAQSVDSALQSDPSHKSDKSKSPCMAPQQLRSRASLRQWQQALRLLKGDQQDQSMRQSGPFLQSGASLIRWTSGHPL